LHESRGVVASRHADKTDPQSLGRAHVPNAVANVYNLLEGVLPVMLAGSCDGVTLSGQSLTRPMSPGLIPPILEILDGVSR
jgi:hypothetical protein